MKCSKQYATAIADQAARHGSVGLPVTSPIQIPVYFQQTFTSIILIPLVVYTAAPATPLHRHAQVFVAQHIRRKISETRELSRSSRRDWTCMFQEVAQRVDNEGDGLPGTSMPTQVRKVAQALGASSLVLSSLCMSARPRRF